MTLYDHFTADELRCRCGCGLGQHDMHPQTMRRLVQLRKALGFPLPVSSAIRCPAHNARTSSTGAAGPHTTGQAIDVRVSGARAYQVIREAPKHGFTGVGVSQRGPHAQRFIHLDDLTGVGRPWLWSY